MLPPRTKFRDAAAFTAIELLAGVAILAILMTLVFAGMEKFRDRALTVKCAQNIRTYGSAILTMIADQGGLKEWDGKGSSETETGQPQFNKWLTTGGYLPTKPAIRCPLADGSQYEGINGRYRFPYSGNMSLCEYYPRLLGGIPAPLHRVALAAETNDWDGWESRTSLNSAMWRGGDPGEDGEIRTGRMPIPRYHGSKEKRGLHFFFLDGSVQLVFPTDNDWRKEPVCAPLTGNAATGYFYHSTHFANLKSGKLTAQ